LVQTVSRGSISVCFRRAGLGRFISADPIFNSGDPQAFNSYGYANYNPRLRQRPERPAPRQRRRLRRRDRGEVHIVTGARVPDGKRCPSV
jgi:hypothetical protein